MGINWLSSAVTSQTDDCILPPQSKQTRYFNTRVNGRQISAHRVVCETVHGPAVAGQVARHSCDNGLCVNPRHLSWGSQKENIQDSLERGRFALGERHGRSKLKTSDVFDVVAMRNSGMALSEIAAAFGVSRPSISNILNGKTWAHVAKG